MSRAFLVSYRPLCRTPAGRAAVARYGLKPYVDGSCRREPDFEARYPTITSLCRGGQFAPRLRVDDRVAYISKKGMYDDETPHWRLTALLVVTQWFDSHDSAAWWFKGKGLSVPRNCMTSDNPPLGLEFTDGETSSGKCVPPKQILGEWDAFYAYRAKAHPTVLACSATFLNLIDPPKIFETNWLEWLSRVPLTRNPPRIDDHLWNKLARHARGS